MRTSVIQQRALDRLGPRVDIQAQRQAVEQIWLEVGQLRHQLQEQIHEQMQVDFLVGTQV